MALLFSLATQLFEIVKRNSQNGRWITRVG
jgi:hypothetical protein